MFIVMAERGQSRVFLSKCRGCRGGVGEVHGKCREGCRVGAGEVQGGCREGCREGCRGGWGEIKRTCEREQ